jgi:hypothetical protein
MEKGPEFKITGDINEQEKEMTRQNLEQRLFNHFNSLSPEAQELLGQNEYPKSKAEIALIELANQETNRLRQRFGLSQYNIPATNYHFVTSEFYRRATNNKETASAMPLLQGIFFDADRIRRRHIDIDIALSIFHETFHLKSFLGLKILETEDEPTQYRSGTSIIAKGAENLNSDNNYHEHFKGLNEATISMLNREFFEKIIDLPAFKKEKEWMQSDRYQGLKDMVVQLLAIPEDEVLIEEIAHRHEEVYTFMYLPQRQVLEYVCKEIQKQFSDQYPNMETVYDEFLKAVFTGGLITIGKLVEKTFGLGSFRLLGHMGYDNESAVATLEALKKARSRQLRDQ